MSTIGAYFRLARVGWVLVREGVISALPSEGLPPMVIFAQSAAGLFARKRAMRERRSDRLSKAVARLGPSYVKIGQFLATRPDVVGAEIAEDLSGLQDRMEFFPTEAAKLSIRESLGRPVGELYTSFDEPIAAASIAQVHRGEVETGQGRRKVAIKVIRPGVRRRFAADLEAMYIVSRLQERFLPHMRRLKPVEVTRTLEQTTKVEMDLRLEAAALSELAENTKSDPGFRVPAVDWERTGRDVVTMEWIDGIKMSDVEALRAAGYDLNALADTLIQSFLRHTLRDGFFHADMHPGNLFVDESGMIVAVDLGIKSMTPHRLAERGVRTHVVPSTVTPAEVAALGPDGVFFSNGPGDPGAATHEVDLLRAVLDRRIPFFGICFGNQILGRALGLETYKM
ncbi:MAG: AarF/UbiB family protein, partial [Rhizobiaceae bacterium]|nr:AarF/UbiB family protein [Rhizobiaceae bacterium]